ncbi:MAG: hypothetical protein NTZ19_06115 [Bacteroidetes bacterium]|nr:hypothetical protein [Bacteroidota bacterium]
MSDLHHILNEGPEPNEEALKRYLEGTASEEERFAIENNMADEAFMNDAVEGLQNFKSPLQMQDYVNQINKELHKQTNKKKRRRLKRHIEDQNWTLISVILIIILCILGYFVIHLTEQQHKKEIPTEQKK